MWDDLATIPLFQFPDLVAYNNKVSSVVYNPTSFAITWNDNKWAIT